MSSSNNEDIDLDTSLPTSECVRRRTSAGPWRNKKEFDQVHEWIYGTNSTIETKEKAVKQLKIWKLRRLNLTSGTILSTLLILEAELKDVQYTAEGRSHDSCALYSSAFTRFINYMSAISQSKNMKTMYATARDLNIDPFLVDLRHICAHSHTMPSLDMFRRASAYCLNWLREFYWDEQKETMIDVDAKSVRKKDVTVFDENVRESFLLYDAISEALDHGCTKVGGARKFLSNEKFSSLKRLATAESEENIHNLVEVSLKSIVKLAKQGSNLKDLSHTFIDAFLEMTNFFESVYESNEDSNISKFIQRHRKLFQTIASNGFIVDLYHALIEIAENEYENVIRRKGSTFWAHQIVLGFIVFQQIKQLEKREIEEDTDRSLSVTTINGKVISKNLFVVYRKLGIDTETTLMFDDLEKCPWTLSFSREYLFERIEHINEFTVGIIRSCIDLVEPPLQEKERRNLMHLIDVYIEGCGNDTNDSDRIYTLENDVLKKNKADAQMKNIEEDCGQQNKFGIWTKASDGQEWSSCPLGRLMWE